MPDSHPDGRRGAPGIGGLEDVGEVQEYSGSGGVEKTARMEPPGQLPNINGLRPTPAEAITVKITTSFLEVL